jgi:hypothetical protein
MDVRVFPKRRERERNNGEGCCVVLLYSSGIRPLVLPLRSET